MPPPGLCLGQVTCMVYVNYVTWTSPSQWESVRRREEVNQARGCDIILTTLWLQALATMKFWVQKHVYWWTICDREGTVFWKQPQVPHCWQNASFRSFLQIRYALHISDISETITQTQIFKDRTLDFRHRAKIDQRSHICRNSLRSWNPHSLLKLWNIWTLIEVQCTHGQLSNGCGRGASFSQPFDWTHHTTDVEVTHPFKQSYEIDTLLVFLPLCQFRQYLVNGGLCYLRTLAIERVPAPSTADKHFRKDAAGI